MKALLVFLLAVLGADLDVVVLKSGRTIVGTIMEESDKRVVIKIKYGKVQFPMSQVEKITRADPPVVETPPAKEPDTGKVETVKPEARKKTPPPKPPPGPAASVLASYERKVAGKDEVQQDLVNETRDKLVALGARAIPELEYAIWTHKDWKVRHICVLALRWLKDPKGIPALIEALNDETCLMPSFGGMSITRSANRLIRENAALALKEIGAFSGLLFGLLLLVSVEAQGLVGRIKLLSDIPMGHKFALRAMDKNADVIKYGEPIGRTTAAIAKGEHVHVHNVISHRARKDDI